MSLNVSLFILLAFFYSFYFTSLKAPLYSILPHFTLFFFTFPSFPRHCSTVEALVLTTRTHICNCFLKHVRNKFSLLLRVETVSIDPNQDYSYWNKPFFTKGPWWHLFRDPGPRVTGVKQPWPAASVTTHTAFWAAVVYCHCSYCYSALKSFRAAVVFHVQWCREY